jgi:hypothetical protein
MAAGDGAGFAMDLQDLHGIQQTSSLNADLAALKSTVSKEVI